MTLFKKGRGRMAIHFMTGFMIHDHIQEKEAERPYTEGERV